MVASRLSSTLANIKFLQNLKKEKQERKAAILAKRNRAEAMSRVAASVFEAQGQLVFSKELRIACDSGRRSGKTGGIARRLYLDGMRDENAGELSVYCTSSSARSEELLGTELRRMNIDLDLGIRRRNRDGSTYYILPNDHRIWLTGIKDKSEVDKLRGPHYTAACIDEAQGMVDRIDSLILDSIEPALLDRNGWLLVTGTPNVQPEGPWHDICTGGQYAHYSWDCRQNPHLPNVDQWLASLLERRKWTWDTPRFRREYLGQWCTDLESLCYRYTRENNWIPCLPPGKWRFGIGIDLGTVEPCAWVVVAYRYGHPKLYIVHAERRSDLSPSRAGRVTLDLVEQFGVDTIIADTTGAGKGFVKEWSERYAINATPANKVDLAGQIAMMDGDIASGAIVVVGEGAKPLEEEWKVLPWNEEKDGHQRGFLDHCSDAARYICRAIVPYESAEDEEPPAEPDPEVARIIQGSMARSSRR